MTVEPAKSRASSIVAKASGVSFENARLTEGMRVYAVGDVHGCLAEMNTMLGLIDLDLVNNPTKKHRIIFVGDYVDRGPDSRGVIEKLIELNRTNKRVTLLGGNHDFNLVRACGEPTKRNLKSFAHNGGLESLASYGMGREHFDKLVDNGMTSVALKRFATTAADHLGEGHLDFLLNLERSTEEGDCFFCHAGIDPEHALNDQDPDDLVWMREPFLSWDGLFQKVVIHGHTPVRDVEFKPHRVNIDTRCVFGGALTALVLESDLYRLLSVGSNFSYKRS